MDTYLSIAVTVAVGLMVARAAFARGRFHKNLAIIKRYRPIHFLTNVPVILVVLTAALLLILHVPFMDKNPILWILSYFFGGDGTGGSNVVFSGMQWKWYALIYLPVLAFALPHLAQREEEDFRAGTRGWMHGIWRSIHFGLIHLIMLIPIGAAIALSIGGLWFTHQYFKGGVERSTTYHAVYNTMLVTVAFISIIVF